MYFCGRVCPARHSCLGPPVIESKTQKAAAAPPARAFGARAPWSACPGRARTPSRTSPGDAPRVRANLWTDRCANGEGAQMRCLFVVSLIGLLVSGCTSATLETASTATQTPRDKALLAHVPYAQASIPMSYQRHIVDFTG